MNEMSAVSGRVVVKLQREEDADMRGRKGERSNKNKRREGGGKESCYMGREKMG